MKDPLPSDGGPRAVPRRLALAWLAAALLLPARSLFGSIRVCPACGTEAAGGESVCRHCGGALPAAPEPGPENGGRPADEEADAPPPGPPVLAPDAGRPDFERTRRALDDGELLLALLWGRNALALMAADPGHAAAGVRLESELAAARARLGGRARTCPACEGNRRLRTQMVTLSGQVIEQEVPGANCPVCRGAGSLPGRWSAAELALALGETRPVYERMQRALGREEWMGIWLPSGAWESLPARQAAAMLRAFGVWCPACSGGGRTGCSPCGGTGRRACPNSRCLQGTELCPDCGGSGRIRDREGGRSLVRMCPGCNSAGRRPCPVCSGQGMRDCEACGGRGEGPCARCQGSGRAPSCARCGGTGLAECGPCRGTGRQRGEPCAACKGEGVALCRACGGFGRAGR